MKRKNRTVTLKNLLSQNTHEFCKSTSLHGLKYVVSEELYPMERIFFALSFVIVVLASGFYMFNVYSKWKTTPVIFVINPEPTFIKKEAFPAVTICNLNQASKDKASLYSKTSIEYAMLQLLCKRKVDVAIADTITDWNNLDRFIMNISQPCEDMLLACRFGAVTFNCSDFFHRIVTDEGLCCVFNMVHAKFIYSRKYPWYLNKTFPNDYKPVEWSAEHGYTNELPEHYVPRTAAGTGESLGLTVTLDVDVDNYYCSSSNSIGFKIGLHSPTDTPHMRETGLLLPPGKETKIRIRAEKVETEFKLHTMNRNLRQCLFQDEKHLENFNYYTQRNCEAECNAALLAENCGCIGYYMPRVSGVSSFCSIYDMSCVERVRLENVARDVCDHCLPSCYDLSFTPDFFSTPLSHAGFGITSDVVKNISTAYAERNVAIVHIYFKEKLYRSSKRTEFISFTDFLASVGGLMGLFLGFSFISLAEFFYYAILRPHRSLQEKRRLAAKKMLKEFPQNFGKPLETMVRKKLALADRRRVKQEQLSKQVLNNIMKFDPKNQNDMQVFTTKGEFPDQAVFFKIKKIQKNNAGLEENVKY